jgi:DNA-binding response OmpR family regulator
METIIKTSKIVILDDDTEYSTNLIPFLSEIFECYATKTYSDIIANLEANKPNLVVMDTAMTEGFEILRDIREDNRCVDIPVVILSSAIDKSMIARGLGLGAIDYIDKGSDPKTIFDRLVVHLDPTKNLENRPKIIVVDDNPSLLKSINYSLHKQYKIFSLTDPTRLETLIVKNKPNLYIFDYNMPKLSGVDLTRTIRSLVDHADTPIIMLTSEESEELNKLANETGINEIIYKPINDKLLRERVAFHITESMFYERVVNRS